jgi:hypothetical protein
MAGWGTWIRSQTFDPRLISGFCEPGAIDNHYVVNRRGAVKGALGLACRSTRREPRWPNAGLDLYRAVRHRQIARRQINQLFSAPRKTRRLLAVARRQGGCRRVHNARRRFEKPRRVTPREAWY